MNIFEGAKLGDKFITKDNHYVVYRDILNDSIQCIIESDEYRKFTIDISYTKDGRAVYKNKFKPEWDVVSRYEKEIDEEKLDKLARNCYKFELNYPDEYGPIRAYDLVRAFKVGYKVAKEE